MPEKPKRKSKSEKSPDDKDKIREENSSHGEPRERSYYYDDAHGYEIYNPEDDEKDDE